MSSQPVPERVLEQRLTQRCAPVPGGDLPHPGGAALGSSDPFQAKSPVPAPMGREGWGLPASQNSWGTAGPSLQPALPSLSEILHATGDGHLSRAGPTRHEGRELLTERMELII